MTSAGSIGIGIYAYSFGTAHITSKGNVTAYEQGIYAYGTYGATINHSGNVTSYDNHGIFAYSDSDGTAHITSEGTTFSPVVISGRPSTTPAT